MSIFMIDKINRIPFKKTILQLKIKNKINNKVILKLFMKNNN